MTKLPQITAREALKKLQKSGMVIKRKTGPHYVLYGEGRRYAVVPKHPSKVLKKGTLYKILEGARLTVEEFMDL
jgi:predicted RNA binding protein YcfA (HicA-like mRNA interferase family)